jgi:hypothetical protein
MHFRATPPLIGSINGFRSGLVNDRSGASILTGYERSGFALADGNPLLAVLFFHDASHRHRLSRVIGSLFMQFARQRAGDEVLKSL